MAIDKLAPEIAQQVIEGGRYVASKRGFLWQAGTLLMPLNPFWVWLLPELSALNRLRKQCCKARMQTVLTKPLGIGILTTAEKKSKLRPEHRGLATETMCQLNKPGADFAHIPGVTAMTDVTGFGLLGHLSEICQGSVSRPFCITLRSTFTCR